MRARDNPFSSERILSVRYRFVEGSWEEFLARLKRSNYRGAIVGPKGHGKTTLLEDLVPRLAALGFNTRLIRLSSERCKLPALQSPRRNEVVLLDGAEQLSFTAWWAFRWRMRHAAGLLITTHRPGRMRTVHCCQTTQRLLEDLIATLLGLASGGVSCDLGDLFQRHGGDLRLALRDCYDLCAIHSPVMRPWLSAAKGRRQSKPEECLRLETLCGERRIRIIAHESRILEHLSKIFSGFLARTLRRDPDDDRLALPWGLVYPNAGAVFWATSS
jgi:hypothetical protein